MPQLTLEQRVAALEQKVAQLANAQGNGPAKDDWRQTIGIFTHAIPWLRTMDLFAGDAGMKEIFDEADQEETSREGSAKLGGPHQFAGSLN